MMVAPALKTPTVRKPMLLQPVPTLRQQVICALRGCITDLTYKPGDRLVERELCALLGVSRTLVREALAQLTAEGLVQNIPHKGPIVSVLNIEEARGFYEVRATLEALAAERFTVHATDPQRLDLALAFHTLRHQGDGDPIRHFLKAKGRFYDVLLEGSGNPILAEMLRLVHTRVTLLRATTLSQTGRLEESFEEVETLMAAIDKKESRAAGLAAARHVKRAEAIALTLLSQQNAA